LGCPAYTYYPVTEPKIKRFKKELTLAESKKTARVVYLYGFNGMEKDNEVKGTGNSYTTEWRQFDPRLGRFMSLDPAMRKYASWSPYSFSFNNPIWWNDPNGADPDGDPEKTTVAASNAVETVKDSDNGSTPAKCNIGVNCAFTEITGSNELSGKKANEMYDQMSGSSNFTPIEPSDAQSAANDGEVVIAAWKNPSGSSGHVALVVPGVADQSGTWNGAPASSIGGIPKVMDTGVGTRTTSQSVNYSFGNAEKRGGINKQKDVVFFKYTPALTTSNASSVSQTSQSITYGPYTLNTVTVEGRGTPIPKMTPRPIHPFSF
jgi:RHS repeat-associated protein